MALQNNQNHHFFCTKPSPKLHFGYASDSTPWTVSFLQQILRHFIFNPPIYHAQWQTCVKTIKKPIFPPIPGSPRASTSTRSPSRVTPTRLTSSSRRTPPSTASRTRARRSPGTCTASRCPTSPSPSRGRRSRWGRGTRSTTPGTGSSACRWVICCYARFFSYMRKDLLGSIKAKMTQTGKSIDAISQGGRTWEGCSAQQIFFFSLSEVIYIGKKELRRGNLSIIFPFFRLLVGWVIREIDWWLGTSWPDVENPSLDFDPINRFSHFRSIKRNRVRIEKRIFPSVLPTGYFECFLGGKRRKHGAFSIGSKMFHSGLSLRRSKISIWVMFFTEDEAF